MHMVINTNQSYSNKAQIPPTRCTSAETHTRARRLIRSSGALTLNNLHEIFWSPVQTQGMRHTYKDKWIIQENTVGQKWLWGVISSERQRREKEAKVRNTFIHVIQYSSLWILKHLQGGLGGLNTLDKSWRQHKSQLWAVKFNSVIASGYD